MIPTPTAATIDNPATIPDSADQRPAHRGPGADRRGRARCSRPWPTRSTTTRRTTKVWGYSPNDDVLIYQDENGSETFTKYDAIDRPIAVRIFRAGQHDSFAGDPIFAPAPVSIPAGPGQPDRVVQGTTIQNFQYDGLSRMTYAFDNNDPTTAADDSTVTDAYDSLGRIIEEAQTIGGQPTQVISSAWRADDLRSALTYPNGRVEVYTYDNLDRLDDRLRPGGLAADRRLRLHRRRPRARAALPAERHARDLPQQRRDGGHRLRRHAPADRDARPADRTTR